MDPQSKLRLLMLVIWLLFAIRSAKPLLLSIKSKNWNKVNATVDESTFDRNRNIYSPKIIYRYFYKGKEYLNDNYTYLGTATLSKKQSIMAAQNHPKNSQIQVYVDENEPENSVIVPGVHWVQILSIVLITMFCLAVANLVEILNFIWPGCEPNCT